VPFFTRDRLRVILIFNFGSFLLLSLYSYRTGTVLIKNKQTIAGKKKRKKKEKKHFFKIIIMEGS
jgi:hypothetical protein